MKASLVTVVGGSGFIGRYIVRKLCQHGYRVRVLCRDTVAAKHLLVSGDVGQVSIEHADVTRPETLADGVRGSDAVIYLPGLLFQSGRQRFSRVHVEGAKHVAEAASAAGATRFIHMSALGVDASTSRYAKTKLAGEKAVREAFPEVTIFRPSLVIGAEDGFFQRFARMNMVAPALPLIGGGKTRFQPVFVEDIAEATLQCLADDSTCGHTYALAGPETYSFRELLEIMAKTTGQPIRFIPLPRPLAMVIGFFNELLPIAPQITRDQVRSLRTDNVAPIDMPGLASLGITPTNIHAMLPSLLKRFVKE
jgi:uncharacterized protein YbjT (DUF2867 family)